MSPWPQLRILRSALPLPKSPAAAIEAAQVLVEGMELRLSLTRISDETGTVFRFFGFSSHTHSHSASHRAATTARARVRDRSTSSPNPTEPRHRLLPGTRYVARAPLQGEKEDPSPFALTWRRRPWPQR